jgi:seryl-tRNA synthetase
MIVSSVTISQMLDIKFIRENIDLIKQGCLNKNINLDIDKLIELDQRRRELIQSIEELRSKQNLANQKIARSNFQDKAASIAAMKKVSSKLKGEEADFRIIEDEYTKLLLSVPQPALPDVPVGKDESSNTLIRTVGDIPKFDFAIKDHATLGKELNILDIERAVKISGARNFILKNDGVLLMEAIMKLGVDILRERGYDYLAVPHLVREDAMVGTGYFPFGEEDAYSLTNDNSFLIGTAEVVLTSYHAGEVLDEKELPIKVCGKSDCYRREAGTYGKDTSGVYRVHQFTKVEQVILCKNDPAESSKMHQELLSNAEDLMKLLKLPYRVMELCTGDMGAGQVKKHDIETWMPSRDSYGETHSCSSFHEFQSRRLNIKYKTQDGERKFVHTLNNTMVASPRILICILENYQKEDGSIEIPEVLRKYMNGREKIERK